MSAEQKEKYNCYGWNAALMQKMVVYKDHLMFDPMLFDNKFCGLYDVRPMYVGSIYSQITICSAVVLFTEGLMAKRRVGALVQEMAGVGMNDATLIDHINKFARVIAYPAYKECRSLMLSHNKVIQADETTMKLTEGAAAGKTRIAYVWSMSSGPFEDYAFTIFHGGESRQADEFIKMLGLQPGEKVPKDFRFAPEYLVTDAYADYDSLPDRLKDAGGGKLVICNCWAHVYRRYRDALKKMGLYDIYKEAIGDDDYQNFYDNLDRLLSQNPRKAKPEPYIMEFIYIAMLISNIFYAEDTLRDESPDSILKYRQEETRRVVDVIFAKAKALAANPVSHIVYSYDAEHNLFSDCSALGDIPWAGAITYMLNQEIKLRAFLLCGEVPLSNNQEERMLRPHEVHRATIKY